MNFSNVKRKCLMQKLDPKFFYDDLYPLFTGKEYEFEQIHYRCASTAVSILRHGIPCVSRLANGSIVSLRPPSVLLPGREPNTRSYIHKFRLDNKHLVFFTTLYVTRAMLCLIRKCSVYDLLSNDIVW